MVIDNFEKQEQNIVMAQVIESHESLGPRGGRRIVIVFPERYGAPVSTEEPSVFNRCNILREYGRNGKAEVKGCVQFSV